MITKIMRTFVLMLPVVFFAGCGANHEAKIRERVTQLIVFSCANDLEGCVSLTDPIFVRSQGSNAVKARFKILNAIVRLGKLTPEKVRIDKIEVADGSKTAQVTTSFFVNDQWKQNSPSRWVQADGQWYVAL